MQCSPHDIKEQLVRALDQDHNVVDMVAVLDCISILEGFPIRREDLEKTRLGRVINELRRKTSDVALQKRAKDLVRSWRKLLPENPNISAVVQKAGPIPPLSHVQAPRVAQLQQSVVSSLGGRTTSPALSSSTSPILRTRNGSGFKPVSPAIPGSPSPSAVAPLASHPGGTQATPATAASKAPNRNSVANKRLRKESPPNGTVGAAKRSRISTPTTLGAEGGANTTTTPAATSTPARTTSNGFDSLLNCNSSINATTGAAATPIGSAAAAAPATGIPSGNSAFESLVRPDSRTGSVHSDDATSNGGFSSSTPRIVPKVKTTQQLIDELKAKSGINVSIDGVVKESAPPKRSAVTPVVSSTTKGKRGRPSLHGNAAASRVDSPTGATNHNSTGVHGSRQAAMNNANFNKLLANDARELSKTKSELMDRFLQSSPQSQSDESNHQENGHMNGLTNGSNGRLGSGNGPSVPAANPAAASSSAAAGAPMMNVVDVEEDIRRIMAQLPPITNSAELLREFEESKDQERLFPPRTSAPTEEEVERISNGQWPCVNGNYDMDGQWRPWNQMMKAQSAGSDPLLVLPYVDIEW
ncbi:mediator of RNA polymerase II transcription subunit 26-like [Galendromus occidentalis]|uniref:Mediator of RNA polymerase II transcription subunit 26 n=1 Tax=Galendromus occidentalis TaxID=34638 RepID=A0AAJ7L5I1_9ACAR|nr:mediator of RNA polymerase II transcription subunit 26-like [Galendromus occidentalis]